MSSGDMVCFTTCTSF